MHLLFKSEEEKVAQYFKAAAKQALKSTCKRSRCGTVIVKSINFDDIIEDRIIGFGFNSPPGNSEARCAFEKSSLNIKVTDKTCCVHAEQRAILDALRSYSYYVPGSKLYFVRVDDEGNIKRSGQPYCTICSKMSLDVGISEFYLWHQEGIGAYNTLEYNELSFKYGIK